MNSNTQIVTDAYRIEEMKLFQNQLDSVPHYIFVGKNIEYLPNDDTIPTPNTNQTESTITTYNNMIFGKKISSADFLPVVKNNIWSSGTVYAQYEPTDDSLITKNFYTVVQKGALYNVYKCLFNNNGSASTVEPDGTDAAVFTSPTDKYVWKYLYTFTSADYLKFSVLTDYIPVIANTSIQAAAVPGTIDVVDVLTPGSGYSNYYSGTLRSQDIRVQGSDTKYALVENASSVLDIYTGCIIKMTSGPAINQYRKIISYTLISGVKVIGIDSPFTTPPVPGNTYEINPRVIISSDGNETANCDAIAIINSNGNTVSSIEVLSAGENYRNSNASVLISNAVSVGVTAVLKPLVSPISGHGYDPVKELFAENICMSVTFSTDEGGFIPVENDYRTVGIIKDPLFMNVALPFNQIDQRGSFLPGETLYQIMPQKLFGDVAVTANNLTISGSNTYFFDSISNGDYIWITDEIHDTFQKVVSVNSNTSITISSNTNWSNTGCSIFKADILNTGVVSSVNVSTIIVDSLHGEFNTNHTRLIGGTTSATTTLNQNTSITINGSLVNNFLTYIQLSELKGTYITNTHFTQDETIATASGKAIFHSESNTGVYILNPVNINSISGIITGQTSGAQFLITNKYNGNLKLDSGEILYLENISPIIRANNSSETVKILFAF